MYSFCVELLRVHERGARLRGRRLRFVGDRSVCGAVHAGVTGRWHVGGPVEAPRQARCVGHGWRGGCSAMLVENLPPIDSNFYCAIVLRRCMASGGRLLASEFAFVSSISCCSTVIIFLFLFCRTAISPLAGRKFSGASCSAQRRGPGSHTRFTGGIQCCCGARRLLLVSGSLCGERFRQRELQVHNRHIRGRCSSVSVNFSRRTGM